MNLKIATDKVTDTQEINLKIAENQEQYITIPANYADGVVAFAFELSEEDIKKILKNNRIYIMQLTFGMAMNPINVAVDPEEFDESCKYTREDLVKNNYVMANEKMNKGGNKNV